MKNGILPEEGLEILDLILSQGNLTQVIISGGDLWTRKEELNRISSQSNVSDGSTKKKIVKNKYKRPDLETSYVAPKSDLEKELASIFAEVLGIDKVGIEDNIFALGADSMSIIQMISGIKKQLYVDLDISTLFDHPTIKKLMFVILKLKAEDDTETVEGTKLPQMQIHPEDRYNPFPLTELQEAYWVGRNESFEMGNVATHAYMEFDSRQLNIIQFEQAWNKMIIRHDMLRAVILEQGTQVIKREVPEYKITVVNLSNESEEVIEEHLESVRNEMSHQLLSVDKWPLFDIKATVGHNQNIRIHFSFDGMILDGWSYNILFQELIEAYQNPDKIFEPFEISYRDYVITERMLKDTEYYRRSVKYWKERLPKLPSHPELPLAKNPKSIVEPKFIRLEYILEKSKWDQLKANGAKIGLTPTGILLSAYAHILARWSKNQKFTINVPRFNRHPFHEQVNDLIGEFASFFFLTVDLSKHEDFATSSRRIQEQIWKDLENRFVSGIEISRELYRMKGDISSSNMPIVFTEFPRGRVGRNHTIESAIQQLGDSAYNITQTSQVWIDNQVHDLDDGLHFNWDIVEEIFPEHMVRQMFQAYVNLLNKLVEEESWNQELIELQLPRTEEKETFSFSEQSLYEVLSNNFEAKKEQVALISPDRSFNYEELFRYADKLAGYLARLDTKSNELVAVIMDKGWEQIVSVMAILRAGAAYVPIDPDQPADRIRYILSDSGVKKVLTQGRVASRLIIPPKMAVIHVDDEEGYIHQEGIHTEIRVGLDDLAYVIYTSGSTGEPKGVMITQKGVINAVLYTNREFQVRQGDKALGLTALHHDMSVYDIFGILGAGATLIIPDSRKRKDPEHWAELIERNQITIWNSVPAMMEMLMEYAESHQTLLTSLRLSFLGGDWIPINLPDRIHKCVNIGMQVVSVGGPTETTLWNIWHVIGEVKSDWKSIPYGRPIANARYYILNHKLEECPDWVPGLMYCGGFGLTKGYLNDKIRSEEKFIIHTKTGERLYCTGDMGRYMTDGSIEFLGRSDYQFNILGFRVEPGEIESVLMKHRDIQNAVVMMVNDKKAGHRILSAYVVLNANENVLKANELRRYLQNLLPDYMVPKQYIFLSAFPLNNNGKIDRNQLGKEVPQELKTTAPTDTVELKQMDLYEQITEAVKSIVELVDGIKPQDNLMDFGINSVDIIKIFNLMEKKYKIRPDMYEFFTTPTLEYLYQFYQSNLEKELPKPEAAKVQLSMADQIIASYPTILDTEERDAFRKRFTSIRKTEVGSNLIFLDPVIVKKVDEALFENRSSSRIFEDEQISMKSFGHMLYSLHAKEIDGKLKYKYASAGGLYPVQVYIHVKEGRIESLSQGIYYYNPKEHRLEIISLGADVPSLIHTPFLNRPMYEKAAFSIFLIAALDAIAPMYGDMSMRFVTMEAGTISHQLELLAPQYGIGICQIGDIEFELIKNEFKLTEAQLLIHSLIGGKLKNNDSVNSEDSDAAEWVEVEI